MKNFCKQFFAILLCTIIGVSFVSPFKIQAKESEINIQENLGVPIGSTLFKYDEFGHVLEYQVTDENTVTLEQAQREYVEQYITGIDDEIIEYDLVHIDDDAKETIVQTFEDVQEALKVYELKIIEEPSKNFAIKSQDTYLKVKYGVVRFKKIQVTGVDGSSYISNIHYEEDETKIEGYLNPVYGIDAIYLDTKDNRVKFKMAGVIAWVDASLVEIIPYAENNTYVSYYQAKEGELLHKIKSDDVSSQTYFGLTHLGPSPKYFEDKQIYYSYDGHYFYNNYFEMCDDVRLNESTHAINSEAPFYNYYQFLPIHSKSNYSADHLNAFISKYYTEKPTSNNPSDLKNNQSLLVNEGESFIEAQKVGVNPMLIMGIAINESGWGRSRISITKNNLFGLSAYDSNTSSADSFESAAACINTFAKQWMTWGYLDTEDYRYFGGHLGDKSSGLNVKYASDPYWGEKAASHSYSIDDALDKKDYQKYSLGIKKSAIDLTIRKKASTSSSAIYLMKNKGYSVKNLPVIIIDESEGSSVEGNSLWYKIYTDHPLDHEQNRILADNDHLLETFEIPYNFEQSFGYVSSAYIHKINDGKDDQEVIKEGWIEENGRWYFYQNNTKVIGWFTINQQWYYFNDEGIMQTGLVKIKNDMYYFDSTGMMQTGWKKVNGYWYYFNESGVMQSGWLNRSGTWYLLAESGEMLTGWQKVNGYWYYFNESGVMQSGWLNKSGTWYLLADSGYMLTGWQKVNGYWYYFNESGVMQSGWLNRSGTWYLLADSGYMLTGWQKVNGYWYYFNESGVMQTGWLNKSGTWYLLADSGYMLTGWQLVNGTWYYLDASGRWIA